MAYVLLGPKGPLVLLVKSRIHQMRVGLRALRIHDSLERLMEISGASHPLFLLGCGAMRSPGDWIK